MRTVLSISLPEKLRKDLELLARQTGRNKSDIIRESLSRYRWEAKFKQVRRQIRPYAKKAGLVTEEEVFEQIS